MGVIQTYTSRKLVYAIKLQSFNLTSNITTGETAQAILLIFTSLIILTSSASIRDVRPAPQKSGLASLCKNWQNLWAEVDFNPLKVRRQLQETFLRFSNGPQIFFSKNPNSDDQMSNH